MERERQKETRDTREERCEVNNILKSQSDTFILLLITFKPLSIWDLYAAPLYGCCNICILYCGGSGRGLVLKWVGHTAGGRSLILTILHYKAFKRTKICPWIEFLNDVSHPNCEVQLPSVSNCFCVWLLHVIQKCCYTSRTRDAGTHTHTHTERVPAAWQRVQLSEIWAEIHKEKEEQATGKRKQSSEVGGLKAVNIMVQGHKLTHVCAVQTVYGSDLKVAHVETLGFWQLATSGRAERLPSRPDYSLKGNAAGNTGSAYVFNANCPCACTFWADFVTSLDFVLFVHIKPEAAGAHSQPAVNTFKKYPVSPFFWFSMDVTNPQKFSVICGCLTSTEGLYY